MKGRLPLTRATSGTGGDGDGDRDRVVDEGGNEVGFERSHDSKKIINQRTVLIADGTIGFLWLLLYR